MQDMLNNKYIIILVGEIGKSEPRQEDNFGCSLLRFSIGTSIEVIRKEVPGAIHNFWRRKTKKEWFQMNRALTSSGNETLGGAFMVNTGFQFNWLILD